MTVRFDDVRRTAQGRWPFILQGLGIGAEFLRDKHGPCPCCGGKDRFRFDDKEGRGTYFCNSCGSGDGFSLLELTHKWDSKECLRQVAGALGMRGDVRAPVQRPVSSASAATPQADATKQAAAEKAATIALNLWEQSSPPPFTHSYLSEKGITAAGIRLLAGKDGPTLLVPLYDAAGTLWSVQRIYRGKDEEGNAVWCKRHLKGGMKAGCFLLLGEPSGCVLVCEGYATGVSLHECAGLAVAVAFDAAGLLRISALLKAKYPACEIVIAADNDAFKAGNPGLTAARMAAKKNGLRVVFPTFSDHQGRLKDWNDLHQHSGATAVQQEVERQLAVDAAENSTREAVGGNADLPPDDRTGPFTLTAKGVFYHAPDGSDPVFVCAPLHVVAQTRDEAGASWGLLLRFSDRDGREKEQNIPRELLAADAGAEAVKVLLSLGLILGPGRHSKGRLVEYLQQANPSPRATLVNKLGWHGNAFMLPERTVGEAEERLVFTSSGKPMNPAAVCGTLQDWQQSLARYCVGNHRLAFSVAVAFAAPLLALTNAQSGGFHFYGGSRSGKSTTLKLAASVYGGPDYTKQWRATDNALESIAAAYSDGMLPLDEISQCDPRIIGDVVYMLGNGRGKHRSSDTGMIARPAAAWRLLFMSNGEAPLERHMLEAGKKPKAGMEMRMLGIPADAGVGLGIFNTLHDKVSGEALAKHLDAAAARCHGTPIVAFLKRLIRERDQVALMITATQSSFAREHLPADASGQARDAANRFALAGLAGELATDWGVTAWPEGTAMEAARVCLLAWLDARPAGTGFQEESAMLSAVRLYLERFGESRFTDLSRIEDNHAPRTLDRAGYREISHQHGGQIFYVMRESFRQELCRGHDPDKVAKLLRDMGALVPEGAASLTRKKDIPGEGKQRFYWIKAAVVLGDLALRTEAA